MYVHHAAYMQKGGPENPLQNCVSGIVGIILRFKIFNFNKIDFDRPTILYISTLLFTNNYDHNENYISCQ